jgi:hypothetical protein
MASSRGTLLALGVRSERGLGSGEVDVFGLIQDLKIRLHLAPAGSSSDDLDGAYIRDGGEAFIFVNTAKWLRRQRMTAAHELGHHYLLGTDQIDYEVDDWEQSPSEKVEEQEAFDFARELLMDRTWILANCRGLGVDAAAGSVVGRFQVSPEAAAVRLAELGVISPQDKDEFRTRQVDPATRLHVGRTPPQTRLLQLDPIFERRVGELEKRELLTPERVEELRQHAHPTEES